MGTNFFCLYSQQQLVLTKELRVCPSSPMDEVNRVLVYLELS